MKTYFTLTFCDFKGKPLFNYSFRGSFRQAEKLFYSATFTLPSAKDVAKVILSSLGNVLNSAKKAG